MTLWGTLRLDAAVSYKAAATPPPSTQGHLGLVLLTEILSSADQVGQRTLDLVPFPRLQTAVYEKLVLMRPACDTSDLPGLIQSCSGRTVQELARLLITNLTRETPKPSE